MTDAFAHFALLDPLRRGIAKAGWEAPTPVQQRVVPAALAGSDLLVRAATGSGKTGAFLLPMLQRFAAAPAPRSATRGLVLVPTRELARQIHDEVLALGSRTRITAAILVGGENRRRQVAALRRNPEVLIATPGRLLEHLRGGEVALDELEMLVLDEADRMLDLGFAEDVLAIVGASDPRRQSLLFSASLDHRGLRPLTERLLRDPEVIALDPLRAAHPDIRHQRLLSDDLEHKQQQLLWLLRQSPGSASRAAMAADTEAEPYARAGGDPDAGSRAPSDIGPAKPEASGATHAPAATAASKALVFTNTRARAEAIGAFLSGEGLRAAVLHGELDPRERKRVMDLFARGTVTVLVATDLAARGLDLPGVARVIHFEVARNGRDYLHRSGRTGRAGKAGTAISLVAAPEWNRMESIARWLDLRLEPRIIDGLAARFQGPRRTGKPRAKAGPAAKAASQSSKEDTAKPKDRRRARKNIGKRRRPSSEAADSAPDAGFDPPKRHPRGD